MDLHLTSEQTLLRDSAAKFIAAAGPKVARGFRDQDPSFAPARLRQAGELGWLGILVPGPSADSGLGLTELAFDGEILVVPRIARTVGDKVRIRIDADDVMLALTRPVGVSANNILPAKIAAIREDGPNADVQLRLKGALLIARITRRSLERLRLQPGASVFALIKSVTVGGRESS